MTGKRTRRTLHQNAELRSPVIDAAALSAPVITGGTQASPTITTPVLSGALSGGTLNTDLAGAAAALEGALLDSPAAPTADPSGASVAMQSPVPQRATFTLVNATISVPNADDYGSVLVSDDMPTAYVLLGSAAALTFTHTDLTGDASTVDMAVGTTAAVNTALSGAADDTVANIDATGTTTGTWTAAAVAQGVAAGVTNDLYLNASVLVGSSDTGVLTISGTIDIWYIPLVS